MDTEIAVIQRMFADVKRIETAAQLRATIKLGARLLAKIDAGAIGAYWLHKLDTMPDDMPKDAIDAVLLAICGQIAR